MTNQLAQFNGHNLEIIDYAGRKWLTAEQAGLALGYAEAGAGKSVNTLYGRHADEFCQADICDIDLMSQGQTRKMRIFSATGCNKLGFFANTPKAKEFRQFAAQALASPGDVQLAAIEARLLELRDLEGKVLVRARLAFEQHPQWVAIADMRAAGRTGDFIAQALGITRDQQQHAVQRIRKAGFAEFLPATALPPVGSAPSKQLSLPEMAGGVQ